MKLVIVDDQLMFRDALRKACVTEFGHQIVGETGSGHEAISLILSRRPDMVILDLSLTDLDGFSVAEHVLHALPGLAMLVVSSYCNEFITFRCEQLNIRGFIDKNTALLRALREALAALGAGNCYFSAAYQAARRSRQGDPWSIDKVLSDTEQEVLRCIAFGLSDAEIGERLQIASTTAQKHRTRILSKLHIDGTPKLMAYANRQGLCGLAPPRRAKSLDDGPRRTEPARPAR